MANQVYENVVLANIIFFDHQREKVVFKLQVALIVTEIIRLAVTGFIHVGVVIKI